MRRGARQWAYEIALQHSRDRKPKRPIPEINAWAAVLLLEIMLFAHVRKIPRWIRFTLGYLAAGALVPVISFIQILACLPRLLRTKSPLVLR